MHWLEKAFNLLFLGPLGIGKSNLAIGLGIQAVELGYQACFMMMGELIKLQYRSNFGQEQAPAKADYVR